MPKTRSDYLERTINGKPIPQFIYEAHPKRSGLSWSETSRRFGVPVSTLCFWSDKYLEEEVTIRLREPAATSS
jgi:DNA-binding HxlR family transcriptional regulator